MGAHARHSNSKPAPVVRWPKPRSAQWPARAAISTPNTPTKPNAPTAVCDKECGGALSGNTNAVQNALMAANISKAIMPRTRSTGSVASSVAMERSRAT
ncbi:hypothetical protein D3C71_1388190 [compost metagenome]